MCENKLPKNMTKKAVSMDCGLYTAKNGVLKTFCSCVLHKNISPTIKYIKKYLAEEWRHMLRHVLWSQVWDMSPVRPVVMPLTLWDEASSSGKTYVPDVS